ncbi:UNVERIFIED_CONTAM: hypothetical protein FKN15_041152 [Acipenser sinensis]
MAPVFYSPVSQTVNAGESAFFECVSGDSRPSAQIRWEKEGKPLAKGIQFQESELPAHNEKNSTLPNPGISLKCLAAWTGNAEGNEEAEPSVTAVGLSSANPTQHQEAEAMAHPNPASLEEGVHTSFTFQTSEPSGSNTTPVRHNINISRSLLAPLVLSHSVSVNERNSSGITTVAVDVHFYSGTPVPSTLPGLVLNSGTIYCPPSSNGQTPFPEYDQQASSVHYGRSWITVKALKHEAAVETNECDMLLVTQLFTLVFYPI